MRLKMRVLISLVVAAAALALLAAGCVQRVAEADMTYAGPMLDNVLNGVKDKDYQEYTKDFSAVMLKAVSQDSFNTLADTLQSKIGDYQSRVFSGAQKTKSGGVDMVVAVYRAKYSKETGDVYITITFGEENGAQKIMGLYFNSANLSK